MVDAAKSLDAYGYPGRPRTTIVLPGWWADDDGGGVVCREVCRHCGAYQVTDSWAQDMCDGEQGLTAVTYEEADAASLAWVGGRAAEEDGR